MTTTYTVQRVRRALSEREWLHLTAPQQTPDGELRVQMAQPPLIVAWSHAQYAWWCHQHGLSPRTEAVYVTGAGQLRGQHRERTVIIVTWPDGQRGQAIYQELAAQGRLPRDSSLYRRDFI